MYNYNRIDTKLQALVDITNYLAEHNFTYDEADEFVEMLACELSESRDCYGYKTADDYYHNRPCCNIGRKVIIPLKKVSVDDL